MAGSFTQKVCNRFLLKSLHKCSRKIAPVRFFTTTSAAPAAWNHDWKPGPYPQTPAEREAAAKKYGLRVEDYVPYDPNTDPGYGDYPKIKWMGASARDPYDELDFPHIGTDYGDVLHESADMSLADRYNPQWAEGAYYSPTFMILSFISVFFGGMALHFLCDYYDLRTHMPILPKQYPDHLWVQRGKDPEAMPKVVHYTFEPASSS